MNDAPDAMQIIEAANTLLRDAVRRYGVRIGTARVKSALLEMGYDADLIFKYLTL